MKPARPASLNARAYTVLKERIISCHWMPGEILVESQLARELDMSKTPIREALQRLTQERLLEPIVRVGYRVAPVTAEDVGHQFDLRCLLEGEAAALAARHLKGETLEILQMLNKPWQHGDRSSYVMFLVRNRKFHTVIAEESGNPRLASLLAALLDEQTRVLHMGIVLEPEPTRIIHEHEELLEALAAGDERLSRLLAETAVVRSREMVLQALRHFERDLLLREDSVD